MTTIFIRILALLLATMIHNVKALATMSTIRGRMGVSLLHMSSSDASVKTWLLDYKYVEGILEKRAPYREGHLKLIKEMNEKGQCVAAGPFDPPTGAQFIFKGASTADAERFVKEDPYVLAGLVAGHSIKQWNVVVGEV
jgi:uncharacterized protein YciI